MRQPFPAAHDDDHEAGYPVDRPGGPRLLTVPSSLAGARAAPRTAAVIGLLIVLAAAAGFFAVRVLVARSTAQPHPVAAAAPNPGGLDEPSRPAGFGAPSAGADAAPSPVGSPTGSPAPTSDTAAALPPGKPAGPGALPTATAVLLVDVVGQVRHPGVVRLAPGARVQDAVAAAGGASKHADLSAVNLARPVADGEQIVVPKPGEQPPAAGGGVDSGAAPGGAGSGGAGAAGPVALVNLNTADVTTLDTLPGVGPVLSQRIIDWRTQNGRFSSVDELAEVSGIGDKILAQLRPRVTV